MSRLRTRQEQVMQPKPHAAHLRHGRWNQPGMAYLVTTVTQDRQRIFDDFRCARALIQTLKAADAACKSTTLTFTVMPDHLHWLLMLGERQTLAGLVGWVKGTSSRQIGRIHGQTGGLWQRGFHDHAVRSEEDLRALARYVVANPLRAGLVDDVGQYAHWDAVYL
jgi:putative transposase